MDTAAQHALLLGDAIDQLVIDPHASQRWHALLEVRNSAPDAVLDAQIAQALRARLPGEGVAGFLRASYLATVSGDAADTAEAGQLLLDLRPFDAERVMAFATHQWAQSLAGGDGHGALHAALSNARLPALMALAGRELARAAKPRSPRAVDAVRKVALVAPFLGAASHPPTEMALQHAALLTELGCQVWLLSCQDLQQAHMSDYLGGKGTIRVAGTELADLQARLPPGVRVSVSDARFSLMLRWRAMLIEIAREDPDLVMFVGLQSPLMFPLHADWPVLGLNVHAIAPLAPVDVWLCADAARAGRDDAEWGAPIGPAYAHYHPFRLPTPVSVAAPLTRGELGLRPQQCVLLSVGHRLPGEIGAAWAVHMLALLKRHPDAVWLLAGGLGTLPPALADADPAQLRLIGHDARLRSVYGCADIYVNPPRVGGGLSAGEAMAAGLPVLALAGGDAGSKLGELALADDDAYFASLEALLAAPALRADTGARLRERFATTLDLGRSHASLRAAIQLAVARFHARIGQAAQALRRPGPGGA